MEKRSAHYRLEFVRALATAGAVRQTASSIRAAKTLGFSTDEMVSVILSLSSADFYKSMTSYGDHRDWQDVYHPVLRDLRLYVKITVQEDLIIISFKER